MMRSAMAYLGRIDSQSLVFRNQLDYSRSVFTTIPCPFYVIHNISERILFPLAFQSVGG